MWVIESWECEVSLLLSQQLVLCGVVGLKMIVDVLGGVVSCSVRWFPWEDGRLL